MSAARAAWLAAAAVACAPSARPRAPAGPPTVAVSGDLAAMSVSLDGRPLPLPSVDVVLDERGPLLEGSSDNLRRLEGAPVRFRATVSWVEGTPHAWSLAIVEVEPEKRRVVTLAGAGATRLIDWDGRDDKGGALPEGALFEAQLRVTGDDGTEATSPRRRFGLVYGLRANDSPVIVRGELFAGDPLRPQASPELGRQIMAIAHRMAPLDELSVEVHEDGTGDKLEKLASTQKQAELVRQLFHAAGIAPQRVKARGRGNLVPLAEPRTAEGRNQNKRMVVVVQSLAMPAGGVTIPRPPDQPPAALVAGQRAEMRDGGRFAEAVPVPRDGRLHVEIVGADGRRQARIARIDR